MRCTDTGTSRYVTVPPWTTAAISSRFAIIAAETPARADRPRPPRPAGGIDRLRGQRIASTRPPDRATGATNEHRRPAPLPGGKTRGQPRRALGIKPLPRLVEQD